MRLLHICPSAAKRDISTRCCLVTTNFITHHIVAWCGQLYTKQHVWKYVYAPYCTLYQAQDQGYMYGNSLVYCEPPSARWSEHSRHSFHSHTRGFQLHDISITIDFRYMVYKKKFVFDRKKNNNIRAEPVWPGPFWPLKSLMTRGEIRSWSFGLLCKLILWLSYNVLKSLKSLIEKFSSFGIVEFLVKANSFHHI